MKRAEALGAEPPGARSTSAAPHLGVTPWSFEAGDAHSLAQQAERAEALGYESFWLPESHFTGDGAIPAPLLLLAAVAARTRRIRLGTTSFLLPVRHPLHVAEEVAVLDRLSGGRVILGTGRGFRKALFTAFDVPRKEKRDRFEAALEVMLSAWRGEPVAFDAPDEDGVAQPVHLAPLPIQRPHPPVWVAAFGPKALAQAGRLGLPYLASPIEPLSRLEENYARHRDTLPDGVHDGLAVPVMRTLFTSRAPLELARARDALSRQAAAMARTANASLRRFAAPEIDDWALVGEPAAIEDGIHNYREKLGLTHLILRGPVPGVSEGAVLESLSLVREVCAGIR